MIEYICKECDISELELNIIPQYKCPSCGKYFEAIEED